MVMQDRIQRASQIFKMGKGKSVARDLLVMTETNRYVNPVMNRGLIRVRFANRLLNWDKLEAFCHDIEAGQLVMEGYSREQFSALAGQVEAGREALERKLVG